MKHFQFSFPAIIIWQRWDFVFKKHSCSHQKKDADELVGWVVVFKMNTPTKRKLVCKVAYSSLLDPFILQLSCFQVVLKYSPLTFFTGTMNEALFFNLGWRWEHLLIFFLICGLIPLTSIEVSFFNNFHPAFKNVPDQGSSLG